MGCNMHISTSKCKNSYSRNASFLLLLFFLMGLDIQKLTLSAVQTKTNTCANSVAPDEMAGLIRLYTVCHFVFKVRLKPIFATMGVSYSYMEETISETQG